MPNILVVGSANMDVIVPAERLPAPGETVLIDDVTLGNGGKGANTAVAVARLGGEVRFVGAVGDDFFGRAIRRSLEANGVDCRYLQTVRGGSGTAIILLHPATGENAILVGAAANRKLHLPEDDEPFRWADMVMMQLETPVEVNVEAALRAETHGVPVILDPAPAQADLPQELFNLCDVVSPNETELALLSGMPVGSRKEAEAAAQALLERGVEDVVVKMAEKGALWLRADDKLFVPPCEVNAVDTTAAGDAFTGALALALAAGRPREEALQEAALAGALTVTRAGAQNSLPTRADVEAFRRTPG